MMDCIAYNPESYVELAVRLATDENLKLLVRQRIQERVDILFDHKASAEAMFDCLLDLAQSKKGEKYGTINLLQFFSVQ